MPQFETQSFPQGQRSVNGFDRYRDVPQPYLLTHTARRSRLHRCLLQLTGKSAWCSRRDLNPGFRLERPR